MKAIVTKIHNKKQSVNGDTSFIRLEFRLDNGMWAKTDICSKYRNFNNWAKVVTCGVGVSVGNLTLRRDGEVDADSYVTILDMPLVIEKAVVEKAKEIINQQEEQQGLGLKFGVVKKFAD